MAKVKNMRRYGVLAILLVVALVASLFAMMPVAQAAPDPEVRVQMVVCVDGSGSISSSDFALMRTGLANAVENNLPRDGSVEFGVNIFGWTDPRHAEVVRDMTVINDLTITGVLADINAMTQPTGWTPTGAAITLATSMMTDSDNWDVADRHIINISTNGHPEPEDPEVGNAIAARNAAITAGVTEIDAECVGVATVWQDWTKDNIVYPEPGVYAPPYPDPPGSQGFVVVVDEWEDYADAIAEKFAAVIPPELTLEPLTDTNCVDTSHTLTATLTEDATPVSGEEITFEVISGPHTGVIGTDETDAEGKAYCSYTGTAPGTDTIKAYTAEDVTSNEVEKTWEPCPPPPIPSITVWGIIAAVVVLGGLGVLMLRRRHAYNAN